MDQQSAASVQERERAPGMAPIKGEVRRWVEPVLVLVLILEQGRQTAGPFRLYFFLHPTSENRY